MDNIVEIRERIQSALSLKQSVLDNAELLAVTSQVVDIIVEAFRNDYKIFFCGNGGSAADAQHLAAEFSGRFYQDRDPLFAEAFHVNTSYLTAVANDYGYDQVYSRLVKAKCRKGDVLIGMSASGNSVNIIKALELASSMEITTVSMTGETGGKMKEFSKYLINVPSVDTPRIQEVHMLLGHAICELVEQKMF